MKIKLNDVRISFPDIFEAKAFNDSAPRYSAQFIFEPDSKVHEAVESAIDAVGEEKWKKSWPKIKAQLESKDAMCSHDGELKEYPGYEGNLYISSSNKVRPMVIDKDKSPLTQEDGVIYSGCYVNAIIDIWAQDNQYGKRVNAKLMAVQFKRAGEPLSGSSGGASLDDFDIEDDDDFDDMLD